MPYPSMRSVVCGLSCFSVAFAIGCGGQSVSDGDDTETDGGTCEIEFEQAAPGTSGEFTVRNDRAVPIYIPQTIADCTFEAWQVLDGDTPVYWNDAYVPTCDDLVADDCNWNCGDGPATAIKLEPGATWTAAWGYYVWEPVSLTDNCIVGTGCAADSTCWAGRTKLEGQLTARLRVTETCDFADACDCGSDACLIESDSITIADSTTETVDISFDASASAIVLAIE